MKKYKDHTLAQYVDVLSQRTPVPGGGSAAALSASLGASLLLMVAHYSLGKSADKRVDARIKGLIRSVEKVKQAMLELVDLDAESYLKVVKARQGSAQEKRKAAQAAARVPLKLAQLCYKAVEHAPTLVKDGNKYLMSDVCVAVELLVASFNGAMALRSAS